MNDPKPTHTGWYLFCPIYMVFEDENDENEGPMIWARWRILEPLFTLANWMQQTAIFLLSMADPDYEPAFMFSGVRPVGNGADE